MVGPLTLLSCSCLSSATKPWIFRQNRRRLRIWYFINKVEQWLYWSVLLDQWEYFAEGAFVVSELHYMSLIPTTHADSAGKDSEVSNQPTCSLNMMAGIVFLSTAAANFTVILISKGIFGNDDNDDDESNNNDDSNTEKHICRCFTIYNLRHGLCPTHKLRWQYMNHVQNSQSTRCKGTAQSSLLTELRLHLFLVHTLTETIYWWRKKVLGVDPNAESKKMPHKENSNSEQDLQPHWWQAHRASVCIASAVILLYEKMIRQAL